MASNQFIGTATACLPLSGGTITGSLSIAGGLTMASAGELRWLAENIPAGNWAKGVSFYNKASFVGGVGIFGNGATIDQAYMGVGSNPWNTGLRVTSSDVLFGTTPLARANGNYPSMTVGNATKANTATSATSATTATSATYIQQNNTEVPNEYRLQYFQTSGNATLMPSSSWWSLIRAQHGGYANGYWQEIALGFTNVADNKGIKYRTNVSGKKSPWYDVALMDQTNGYWGFYFPTNSTYLRTPPSGLLPNASGNPSGSVLGTSSWRFASAYINTVYGNLSGNATTATTATTANTATTATTANNLTYFKNTSTTTVGVDDTTANAIGYVNGISLMGKIDGGLFKQVYSASWAGEIFIDYRTGMLATRGKNNGTWTSWNNVVSNTVNYIPAPLGGTFVTSSSTQTGVLKIKLPVGFTATMMKFTVDIYNYATGESCTYYIGGYNYSSPSWVNASAYSNGYFNSNRSNLQVNFCNDGGIPAVCIGAVGTTWNYPQVVVRDVLLGYSGYTNQNWQQAKWNISFSTTMPTVNTTVNNPASWYKSYYCIQADTATNATNAANASKLGNVAAANYINTSDTLILRGTV